MYTHLMLLLRLRSEAGHSRPRRFWGPMTLSSLWVQKGIGDNSYYTSSAPSPSSICLIKPTTWRQGCDGNRRAFCKTPSHRKQGTVGHGALMDAGWPSISMLSCLRVRASHKARLMYFPTTEDPQYISKSKLCVRLALRLCAQVSPNRSTGLCLQMFAVSVTSDCLGPQFRRARACTLTVPTNRFPRTSAVAPTAWPCTPSKSLIIEQVVPDVG